MSLGIFVLVGLSHSSSSLPVNYTTVYGLTLAGIMILLFVTSMFLLLKRQSFWSAFILFVSIILVSIFALTSLNCARCLSSDFVHRVNIFNLQNALHLYHNKQSTYPVSLRALSQKNLTQAGFYNTLSSYQYTRQRDSYKLCTNINRTYFYSILIGVGDKYCIGPNSKISSFPSSH